MARESTLKAHYLIRVFDGSRVILAKQVDELPIVIGRPGSDVTVAIDHDDIAPIHCLIEDRDGQFFLCDLGSQTGTYLNGKSIIDEPISSPAEFKIGPFKIEFRALGLGSNPSKESQRVVSPLMDATSTQTSNTVVADVTKNQPHQPSVEFSEALSSYSTTATLDPVGSEQITGVSYSDKNKWPSVVRKKSTWAPGDSVQLRRYLKPDSGNAFQVVQAWGNRILYVRYYGPDVKAITYDQVLGGQSYSGQVFIQRRGPDLLVRVRDVDEVEVLTNEGVLTREDLHRLGRFVVQTRWSSLNLKDFEIVHISDGTIHIYVRRVPTARKVAPLGFLDSSYQEISSVILAVVLTALVMIFMILSKPEETADDNVPLRVAEIVYENPILPKPVEKVELPVKPPEPPKTQVEPKVPDPEKLVKVKVSEKPQEVTKLARKEDVGSGPKGSGPTGNVEKKPKAGGPKVGSSIKTSPQEGAQMGSQEPDPTQLGLLSALGSGGTRAQLDKAYQGSGELFGTASRSSGYSGQATDRPGAGNDLGDVAKGIGQGIKTEKADISNIGTRGRGSGEGGYGTVGSGTGKGRVQIDVPGSEAEFLGSIDKEAVRRVIRSALSQIRSCYERALLKNPALKGKVVIYFEIGPSGQVVTSRPKSQTLDDPSVGTCVAQVVARQRFPTPPPGTIAVVEYPFLFESGQ